MGKKTLIMKFFILLIFIFGGFQTFAQNELPKPKSIMEVGIALGSYRGDLSPSFSKVNGGVNVGFLFNTKKRWHIRADLSYLYLQGQTLHDENYLPPLEPPFPNDFFQSHTLNTSVSFMFNIINKRYFKLYVAQGIGIFYYNPLDQYGNELIENYKDENNGLYETRNENETYTNFAFSMPTRIGVTYYFKNNFGLGLSATFVNPFTDYLDNVSELGAVSGNDQAMSINMSFFVPLTYGKLNRVHEPN